jgi:hypothetical protein
MKTELQKKTERYFTETAKHLFRLKDTNDVYYKVLSVEIEGQLYGIRIHIGDNVTAWVRPINVTTKSEYGEMTDHYFNDQGKHEAVKRIKRFEEYFEKILANVAEWDVKDANRSWYGKQVFHEATV